MSCITLGRCRCRFLEFRVPKYFHSAAPKPKPQRLQQKHYDVAESSTIRNGNTSCDVSATASPNKKRSRMFNSPKYVDTRGNPEGHHASSKPRHLGFCDHERARGIDLRQVAAGPASSGCEGKTKTTRVAFSRSWLSDLSESKAFWLWEVVLGAWGLGVRDLVGRANFECDRRIISM